MHPPPPPSLARLYARHATVRRWWWCILLVVLGGAVVGAGGVFALLPALETIHVVAWGAGGVAGGLLAAIAVEVVLP